MSQNVIFDLSNATARSRGQAIRRQHPNLSSDARKAHRKAARQKRTKLKKQGSAERKIREEQSQEASLAPVTRMKMPNDIILKESFENGHSHHDHDANSRIDYSAFAMFPRFQRMANKRALGQANRYMNANAKKQSEQDTGGTRGMKSGKLSADGQSLITELVDEDGKIAESTALTLMNISKGAVPSVPLEQPTEIYLSEAEERDLEQLFTNRPIKPGQETAFPYDDDYWRKPLGEDFTKGFAFMTWRDSRIPRHYTCKLVCHFCYNTFNSVGGFKDHILYTHFWEHNGSTIACKMCNRTGLDPEKFFDHIDGCVLRWKETRAAGDPNRPPVDD